VGWPRGRQEYSGLGCSMHDVRIRPSTRWCPRRRPGRCVKRVQFPHYLCSLTAPMPTAAVPKPVEDLHQSIATLLQPFWNTSQVSSRSSLPRPRLVARVLV
jgi:hypothetical protein